MYNKKLDIIACYKLLEECISFEHIEDEDFIYSKLCEIDECKHTLSTRVSLDIERFIREEIEPILNDDDYFEFLKKPEYGSRDEKGHFVINSFESLIEMILLQYEHTLKLNEKLLRMISKHL